MTTFPTVIADLPEEILLFIFSKLTLPERKSVRRVCKQWLDICNSANITQHERVKLNVNNLHLFKTCRSCLNLEIDNKGSFFTDLRVQHEFWIVHGESVRSLSIKIFDHHLSIIYKIINHCCNVKDLILEFTGGSCSYKYDDGSLILGCDKLNSLVSLTLTGRIPLVFLADASFLRLVGSVPNLKRLVLNFLNEKEKFYEVPIMPLIVKQVFTLTELVLYGCVFATDLFLDSLFELLGHQLTGLFIKVLLLDSIDCLTKHSEKLPNLKNLELNTITWGKGRSNSLTGLVGFKKLEFFSLFNTMFDDEDVKPLIELKSLKGLNIGRSFAPPIADGVLRCFETKDFPNLVALQMRNVLCVTDDVLKRILPHLPSLRCINLNYCDIGSVGVDAIFTNCKHLTHLAVGAYNVGHVVQLANVNSLSNLVYLDLSYRFYTPNVVEIRLNQLETIGLANAVLPDDDLKVLFTNCPRLKYAYVSGAILERVSNLELVRDRFRNPCRPKEPSLFYFNK